MGVGARRQDYRRRDVVDKVNKILTAAVSLEREALARVGREDKLSQCSTLVLLVLPESPGNKDEGESTRRPDGDGATFDFGMKTEKTELSRSLAPARR